MNQKKVSNIMKKLFIKAAYKEAEKNVNSACVFVHYQPEMPESAKKLLKK
ncbi:cyclic lactone autoinducer peptide [Anaerocolumna xylanovorans DSM 12503]|uniref:Cyclic lactone autoinducer peptide n=2 Tax=Anaerocolumna TaxID=1843210 RepID=A0A1M7YII2_9FIRM|nr:cyclic lactone autoinducer peptide [Anaerocolumna xylanovorans DSM 12503]